MGKICKFANLYDKDGNLIRKVNDKGVLENYSIEEFKSQLENSKATFGKDVDYDKFVDLYFKHLQEYKKLSKDLKKNQQHWIETCNKLVK